MRNTRKKKHNIPPSPETVISVDGRRYYDVGASYLGGQLLNTTAGDFWIYPCDKWRQENNHMMKVA